MRWRRAGVAGVALALALPACSGGAARNRPAATATPSTTASATEARGVEACPATATPPATPVERLTVLSVPSGTMTMWSAVPGADCVVVSRSGAEPVRLAGTATSYTWLDPLLELDLTNVTVRPMFYVVVAYRDGREIRRFGGFVDCPPLVFVAARGSGQNGLLASAFAGGLGDRAARVLELLRAGLGVGQRELPGIAVDYPAVAVALNPDLTLAAGNAPGIYAASVRQGVRAAKTALLRVVTACRKTRIVLFGYSQGAQVVGDAFASLGAARARVARVILLADATYAPGDPRVTYLPGPLRGHGIKGARARLPGGDAVVESWCWSRDAICQRPPYGSKFHGSIYDDYERRAVANAVAALRAEG